MPLIPSRLAMSTSWRARRSPSLASVLDAVRDLGFHAIELNGLTPAMVAELPGELARTGLMVQSVHSPCPWPTNGDGEHVWWTDVPELSAPEPAQRARAVSLATRTIELARRTGAQAIILHLGNVPVTVPQRTLFDLLRAGRRAEFEVRQKQAVAEREARKGPHLEAALQSIRELGERAAGTGVALGAETRDGYQEIPSLAEFDAVFEVTEGLPVYYWHDVGHAAKQQLLGLATQETYLRRFAARLVGIHLHDMVIDHDHYPPGAGQVDLPLVARLLPEGVLRTLELSDRPEPAEVLAGVQVLQKLGLA